MGRSEIDVAKEKMTNAAYELMREMSIEPRGGPDARLRANVAVHHTPDYTSFEILFDLTGEASDLRVV